MKKDFQESFSDVVRVGIVTSMMPLAVQEFIYTAVGDKIGYEATIEKIRTFVSNKTAMTTGPTPMDIGRVDEPTSEQDQGWQADQDCEECWGEVDAICHGCGGWGHFRRECPSVKGKGKGKGKAGGKGGGSWSGGGG